MYDVIVYLWVEMSEISKCLDPEFWEHEPGCPTVNVSMKNPTEAKRSESLDATILGELGDDTMLGESRDFILLKRKIYLVPPCLILRTGEIQYEGEKCRLEWNPIENTVIAKNQYGTFSLLPAD